MTPLLDVDGLKTYFATDGGEFRAVDGVSFAIGEGRTLGIVGESGCGKSVTSLSIMGLVPKQRCPKPRCAPCVVPKSR
jgi:ABC-type dipeptide/oligopeptide/nickel transport system ATPase component